MRARWIYRLLTFLSLILTSCVNAQDTRLIAREFKDVPFSEFSKIIKGITGYQLYYKPEELDTVRVNVVAENISLPDLLKKVFDGTAIRFSLDNQDNVFLYSGIGIQTSLPEDFFNVAKSAPDTSKIDIMEAVSKGRQGAITENRLFEIGIKENADRTDKAIVSGYIRNGKTGESFSGAIVYIDTPYAAVVTDQFGYYSIGLKKGRHLLNVSSIGMKLARRNIMLHGDGTLNIELEDSVPSLKNITVYAQRNSSIRGMQMGVERLNIKTIKKVPVLLGEADVLRVLLTLPGVTSVGEASNGFNVRGGSTDQNLVLFSDATIYNPSHLFGFFSAFNPDVVKEFELYKSAIPEKYGGRLSSVLDVTMKDGNSKKVSGTGGIGVLTSKLTVEGPIKKDKTTFIVSGRTVYSNWLLKQIPKSDYSRSKAGFSDLNLRISHNADQRNSFYLTGYFSDDNFKLNTDTLYKYGNRNVNIKWKHIFNTRLNGVFLAGFDNYRYAISSDGNPVNAYRLRSSISQGNLRADFNYSTGGKHALNFGLNSIYYDLKPGSFLPVKSESLVQPDILQNEQALEWALYLGDQFTVSPNFSINAGIRYSLYQYLGPRQVYKYAEGVPREKTTITDTLSYSHGQTIKTYHGPEYRFVARYLLSNDASFKLSVNSLRQYIHMLSNTIAISPSDIWKLSDPVIKPQRGYQVSLGYYKNFRANTIETSIEIYFKRMRNYLDYKSGAVLLMNHHIEADVLNTRGKAYGAELSFKKKSGKMTGWISYTYARTLLQLDDPLAGQNINDGKYYPANFDKPHSANLVGNYQFSHRFTTSLNIVYSTGRPITLPIAIFHLGGGQRVYYSDRNQYRVPDYFRIDLSFNIEGNHKLKKLTHNSWSFGVYNLLARQNPYSIYFTQEAGAIKGYQLSVIGTAVPFITYNFRF